MLPAKAKLKIFPYFCCRSQILLRRALTLGWFADAARPPKSTGLTPRPKSATPQSAAAAAALDNGIDAIMAAAPGIVLRWIRHGAKQVNQKEIEPISNSS